MEQLLLLLFTWKQKFVEMDNDNEVVIFYSSMPWEFNDKEKMLTENSLKTLLKSYMDELEIPEEEYRFYHMVFM